MALSIILPTRGRPERLIPTLAFTLPNLRRQDTRIVIAVDDDDDATIGCFDKLPNDPRIVTCVAPREDSLGAKYNRVLKFPADVYMYMTDYGIHVTPGFDQKVVDAAALFPDGIGCVVGHMANWSFPAFFAPTQRLVELMGYYYPEYFPYWFVDHWLNDIALMIGRMVMADVVAMIGQKPPTMEMREPAFWGTLFDALRIERREMAERIIAHLDEPEWRKTTLRANFPLIEHRSQLINGTLRESPNGMMNDGLGGDRYDRLKAQAFRKFAEVSPAILAELGAAA